MRTLLSSSVRSSVLRIVVSSVLVLSATAEMLAAPPRVVRVFATGQIVSRDFCSATELCQDVQVTGNATVLGPVSGVLSERVDLATGTYTGTGTFTTSDGSTITTAFSGQVTPPDQNGRAYFFESHQIVSGTGQYANASGQLNLFGTGDAAGALTVVGAGTLIKG